MNARTIIEINEFNACKVTIEKNNGTKAIKRISYEKMLKLLNAASSDAEIDTNMNLESILTDILPGDEIISTVQIKEIPSQGSKWYILLREAVPVDMKHLKDSFKKVAMPRTLFAIKVANDKCAQIRICCVKDRFISPDSTIYRYPYSNVFDTRSVCLGNNRLNDFNIGVLTNIAMIPEMFLAMTNNDHGYYGSNSSGYGHKDLLELMSNAEFDNSILVESCNTPTYQSFVNSLS